MALGVVAIGVLSYLSLNRPPPPEFTAPDSAAATTGATTDAPATTGAPAPSAAVASGEPQSEALRMLVVGDSFTTASPEATVWTELVRADLDAAGRPMAVTVTAGEGTGYAEPGPDGTTFPALAQQAGAGFDLVIFFGSRHDIAAAPDVSAAAGAAFAAARAANPEAELMVIGPAWPGPPPGYIVTNRDALAAAVVPDGAVFVDPLAAGWFSGTEPGLVTPDGVRPTAAGHRYLADLIRPVIEEALPSPS
jgi:hypothetical protein